MPNNDDAWLDFTHEGQTQDDDWPGFEEWCEDTEEEHDAEAEFQDYRQYHGACD